MTKEELEKEKAELQEENGKLLQRIAQLEKDVTENESDCSMCDFPKLKQDLEKEKCELLGIIQGKDTAIQNLQKENAELKQINSETIAQLNLDNGELIIENEKLRKENAELKENDDFWEKRYWVLNDVYVKVATKNDNKLTEAKEIIDAFLDFESSCQERGIYISDEMREKANKFLEEE